MSRSIAAGLMIGVPALSHAKNAYEGMSDSAGWRTDALKRIESHRMADFNICVTGANDVPLENAEVTASLHRHEFGFGASARLSRLFDEKYDEDHRSEYLRVCDESFHKLVAENAFKWKYVERNRDFIRTFLSWCHTRNIPVRGHTLVWPGMKRIPSEIVRTSGNTEAFRRHVREHVKSMAMTYKEPLVEWDVLNEPFTENEFMKILGEEEVGEWFRIVAHANPRATRYINDFGVLTRSTAAHQDFYFNYVRNLLDRNVPVQGIGFQSHTPARFAPTPPENLLATLDRFSALGLELQITEFDFETDDLELQARYTEDFLTAIFSHPSTTGLLHWTPFEYGNNVVPKPSAAMFDRNLKPKPNGLAWNALVNRRWRSEFDGQSGSGGTVHFRGFKGIYKVVTSAGSTRKTSYRRLGDDNSTTTIRLS